MTYRRNEKLLVPTAFHTVGPFFPPSFFHEGDNDLTLSRPGAPLAEGERIAIAGRVVEEGGGPAVNAILELWQADARGRFNHPCDPNAAEADPNFPGWGRAFTDAEGRYRFATVRPGAYGPRAPHVNIAIVASGIMRRLVTTLFFPDETANATDPVLAAVPPARRDLLVARRDEGGFRFDIVLRGPGETPFFRD
jgi:protocatechuate 3,4-dioxygenase alpha subunit